MSIVKFKGVPIVLADGVTRIAPPLNMRALMNHHETVVKFDGQLTTQNMVAICEVVLSSLSRNYPDLTMDNMLDWIDVVNAEAAFQAVMGVSKLEARSDDAGEAGEAGSTGQS